MIPGVAARAFWARGWRAILPAFTLAFDVRRFGIKAHPWRDKERFAVYSGALQLIQGHRVEKVLHRDLPVGRYSERAFIAATRICRDWHILGNELTLIVGRVSIKLLYECGAWL